jgi:hypothetical protein
MSLRNPKGAVAISDLLILDHHVANAPRDDILKEELRIFFSTPNLVFLYN